jgi:hypothetical protein
VRSKVRPAPTYWEDTGYQGTGLEDVGGCPLEQTLMRGGQVGSGNREQVCVMLWGWAIEQALNSGGLRGRRETCPYAWGKESSNRIVRGKTNKVCQRGEMV